MQAAGAHQPTFFSISGPANALHQRAREAREYKMWVCYNEGALKSYLDVI